MIFSPWIICSGIARRNPYVHLRRRTPVAYRHGRACTTHVGASRRFLEDCFRPTRGRVLYRGGMGAPPALGMEHARHIARGASIVQPRKGGAGAMSHRWILWSLGTFLSVFLVAV